MTPPLQSQNDSQQLEPLKTPQPQPKQQQQQQQPNNEQDKEFTANFNFNTFLPPPTPPNLINGSPGTHRQNHILLPQEDCNHRNRYPQFTRI